MRCSLLHIRPTQPSAALQLHACTSLRAPQCGVVGRICPCASLSNPHYCEKSIRAPERTECLFKSVSTENKTGEEKPAARQQAAVRPQQHIAEELREASLGGELEKHKATTPTGILKRRRSSLQAHFSTCI